MQRFPRTRWQPGQTPFRTKSSPPSALEFPAFTKTHRRFPAVARIERAVVSVSDKNGIVEFARGLVRLGIEIVSTGGTATMLRENNIPVRDVSDLTGFPEMMDGRVKTLHPKLHGGILARRDRPDDVAAARAHDIGLIDIVVVNLYP